MSTDPINGEVVGPDLGAITVTYSEDMLVGDGTEATSVINPDNYALVAASGGPFAVDHCTFGVSDLGEGIQIRQDLPDDTFTNSIVYGVQLEDGEYALNTDGLSTEDYNAFYDNTGERNVLGGAGPNDIEDIDPLDGSQGNGNGRTALRYLTRVEGDSDLHGKADDGGDIGVHLEDNGKQFGAIGIRQADVQDGGVIEALFQAGYRLAG